MGRACVLGCARPLPAPQRAACSSAFVQTRGCPCNSSFTGIFPPLPHPTANLACTYHCRGAKCRAPTNKYLGCASSYLRAACPKDIDRHAQQHDHQARPGCLRLVKQQDKHNRRGCNDVEQRDKWIAKRFVGSLRAGPFTAQYENACDRQHIEDQHGKDDIVEQIAVKVAVSYLAGRIHVLRAQQNQDDDPKALDSATSLLGFLTSAAVKPMLFLASAEKSEPTWATPNATNSLKAPLAAVMVGTKLRRKFATGSDRKSTRLNSS